MRASVVKWLGLGGFLGFLGFPLHQPSLFVLYGLGVFLAFLKADERSEVNLGRAASFTYVLTLGAFVLCFLVLGEHPLSTAHDNPGTRFAVALLVAYGLHILGFALSYIYFDARGD